MAIQRARAAAEAGSVLERLLTPQEIAAAWQVDTNTIRRIFVDMEGVLKIGRTNARGGRRSYLTLRIPQGIVERVYRERSR
jgi:hypothetical protein